MKPKTYEVWMYIALVCFILFLIIPIFIWGVIISFIFALVKYRKEHLKKRKGVEKENGI